ncbi:MAG: hypothetical protein WB783_18165 [Arenicellales bacterium]
MAITAPVLERLHALRPDLEITVTSGLPEAKLRERIRCPFKIVPDRLDFGLRMRRDLSVDAAATIRDYARLHRRYDEHVSRRAHGLERSGCDLLLANISYLNIAAADLAGVPAIALSPLNWADLYRYFTPHTPGCAAVFDRMIDAYSRCDAYLAPEPCMPMPHIQKVEIIPPVAQTGRNHRALLDEMFGLDSGTALLLLALGGQQEGLTPDTLPMLSDVRWLVEDRWGLRRRDLLSSDATGLSFPDLLASSDLLVCKPGYGAFAEAACLGKPVVYLRRPDWPEEPHLIDWLRNQVPCREGSRRDAGQLESCILELLSAARADPYPPRGIEVCALRVMSLIR